MMNKNKKEILIVVIVVVAVIAIAAIATVVAAATTNTPLNAQILEKDDIPDLSLGGNVTTLGEIDLSVDFFDSIMPPNGTTTLSTAGITDVDITSLPPAGMTLILDNKTATVTFHPVVIQADTSADDSPSTDSSNGGSGGDAEDE